MKLNLVFIFIAIILLSACNRNSERKIERKDNELITEEKVTKAVEQQNKLIEKAKSETESFEDKRNRELENLKDSCRCIDSYFSNAGAPYLESSVEGFHFIVCGYERDDLNDSIAFGIKNAGDGVYFSGFEVFECNVLSNSIISNGEYHTDRIALVDDKLEIERCVNLPIGKDWEYVLTPLFKIRLLVENNDIVLDTTFVLDISHISEEDIAQFKMDSIKRKSPEYEIDFAFIRAIKEYPEYNNEFYNLGTLDGYLGPMYDYSKEYFKIIEHSIQ